MSRTVVIIGLDPNVVDFADPAYAGFPGLTAEILAAALEKDRRALVDDGYRAILSLWDKSDEAPAKVIADLTTHRPDAVMIGAGVRLNPALTTLFETLVNLAREHAPQARLCFNSGPYDTAAAVARQV